MRLFVSADLDGLAPEISDVQSLFEDADGIRTTDPTQAHVTLKFLGDTPESKLPEIATQLETAVEQSGVTPFEAAVRGLGAFPSLDYISVVWLGIGDGSHELERLHQAVENRLTRIGFEPEDHEFTPHATIARMDHAGGKDMVQETIETEEPIVGGFELSEIRLTESELTPEGPNYSTVQRFEL